MRNPNNVASRERRRKLLKAARGYRGGRHALLKSAKETVQRAWAYAFRHRKTHKREMRALWIQRINAAVRPYGLSYSRFIHAAQKAGLQIDRKAMADLAMADPAGFGRIVQAAKAARG